MESTKSQASASEAGDAALAQSHSGDPVGGSDASVYYPENESMLRGDLVVRYERFADLREQYLLGFGYQTARAYWGDLEHFHDWSVEHEVNVLAPTPGDVRAYLNELLAVDYSPNTAARRRTTLRAFYTVVIAEGVLQVNPVSKEVKPIPRRLRAKALTERRMSTANRQGGPD